MGYADEVGQRLRAVRGDLGLSLQELERRSGGAWKAAVVGSYERGDRTISVTRLCELADYYRVPVGDLLPEDGPGPRPVPTAGAIVLDLAGLEAARDRFPGVARYVDAIRVQRGDFNNRLLSLRAEDVRVIAIIEDVRPAPLLDALARSGVVSPPA